MNFFYLGHRYPACHKNCHKTLLTVRMPLNPKYTHGHRSVSTSVRPEPTEGGRSSRTTCKYPLAYAKTVVGRTKSLRKGGNFSDSLCLAERHEARPVIPTHMYANRVACARLLHPRSGEGWPWPGSLSCANPSPSPRGPFPLLCGLAISTAEGGLLYGG